MEFCFEGRVFGAGRSNFGLGNTTELQRQVTISGSVGQELKGHVDGIHEPGLVCGTWSIDGHHVGQTYPVCSEDQGEFGAGH